MGETVKERGSDGEILNWEIDLEMWAESTKFMNIDFNTSIILFCS